MAAADVFPRPMRVMKVGVILPKALSSSVKRGGPSLFGSLAAKAVFIEKSSIAGGEGLPDIQPLKKA
jgi:hypothetical protein